MEDIEAIETEYGVIIGRDGIYLDLILYPNENELLFKGELRAADHFKKFELKFSTIVYSKAVEFDFDNRDYIACFGVIENSQLLKELNKQDHSSKLNAEHRHYYFSTYDTVFEIISDRYELIIA